MIDKYGRDVTYARISLTDRCNLSCKYCIPSHGIEQTCEYISYDSILNIIESLANIGIKKIRFTGGEPFVREGFIEFLERATKIQGIEDWAITTNGIMLNQYAKKLKQIGISHLNISLDTLDKEQYRYITRVGNIDNVLSGIQAAIDAGIQNIKLNCVLIKGISENQIVPLSKLANKYNIDVRFIEIMPIGGCAEWSRQHYLSSSIIFNKLPNLERLEGNAVAQYYKLPSCKGRIGIISPISCDFCDRCNRIRITSDGKIKPCLHSNDEIDVTTVLEDRNQLFELIEKAIKEKPEKHRLNENESIIKNMAQIGG